MRTIIAGSRTCCDYSELLQAVRECGWDITRVISGGARGVDRLGEQWAFEQGLPLERYPVTSMMWREEGRGAGMMRNARMAEHADALIALWDGTSPGTKGMIDIATRKGLRVHVHFV